MKTYKIDLPTDFNKVAKAAFKALDGDGCLFMRGSKIIFTDEAQDIKLCRILADSFDELEEFLTKCAGDWLQEGVDDPMVQAFLKEL